MRRNLNRATIALLIHTDHGIPLPTCAALVDGIIERIMAALERGEEVIIMRFGTFRPQLGAAKVARDWQTMEPITAPPKMRVKFLPSDALRDRVSGGGFRDGTIRQPGRGVPRSAAPALSLERSDQQGYYPGLRVPRQGR